MAKNHLETCWMPLNPWIHQGLSVCCQNEEVAQFCSGWVWRLFSWLRGNAMNMGMQQQPGMQPHPLWDVGGEWILTSFDDSTQWTNRQANGVKTIQNLTLSCNKCSKHKTDWILTQAKYDDDSKHGRLLSCARALEIRQRTPRVCLFERHRNRSYVQSQALCIWRSREIRIV